MQFNQVQSRKTVFSLIFDHSVGFSLWLIEWCDRRLCHVTLNARIRGWSTLD